MILYNAVLNPRHRMHGNFDVIIWSFFREAVTLAYQNRGKSYQWICYGLQNSIPPAVITLKFVTLIYIRSDFFWVSIVFINLSVDLGRKHKTNPGNNLF